MNLLGNTELLRFTTAGSVDDGKSTLIGRLLYDSKSIFQDQYEAIERVSQRRGESEVNLALLTDGLKSEREQGITIDVAYRYFSTPKRKFIIADTPGHVQYTRNMITGASTANVALILVDARKGVIEQTRRHAVIASLLRIPHWVICVNKMDLVDYDSEVYERIKDEFTLFSSKLSATDIEYIPISALNGDNVVQRSTQMDWYQGATLMYHLENVHIASDSNLIDNRFPVQHVIRPYSDEFHDYRGYAGRVASGTFKVGDKVVALPSGFSSTIKTIQGPEGEQLDAIPNESVTILLEDEIDISRGDMLVRERNQPESTQDIEAMVCWFDQNSELRLRGKYLIQHTTQQAKCIVKDIKYKLNIETLHRDEVDKVMMNDIVRVSLRTTKPLFVDSYSMNRMTGSFVLIDEGSNNTVGVGMIK